MRREKKLAKEQQRCKQYQNAVATWQAAWQAAALPMEPVGGGGGDAAAAAATDDGADDVAGANKAAAGAASAQDGGDDAE